MFKTATDGDELFTMQPNFGAKMVKDKTRQVVTVDCDVACSLSAQRTSIVVTQTVRLL